MRGGDRAVAGCRQRSGTVTPEVRRGGRLHAELCVKLLCYRGQAVCRGMQLVGGHVRAGGRRRQLGNECYGTALGLVSGCNGLRLVGGAVEWVGGWLRLRNEGGGGAFDRAKA